MKISSSSKDAAAAAAASGSGVGGIVASLPQSSKTQARRVRSKSPGPI